MQVQICIYFADASKYNYFFLKMNADAHQYWQMQINMIFFMLMHISLADTNKYTNFISKQPK
jgi:hypothetical protein